MADLSEKLAGLLNDPETMERVKKMAEGLLGEGEATQKSEPNSNGDTGDISGIFGGNSTDAQMLKGMMGILGKLKEKGTDERSNLLMALRPHLSEPRQEKLDTALKILRIIDMLPLLKDSGLLNF